MMKSVRVVVVGAGVIGFSTAVCIVEALPFCSVTLMADKFSPDTTSDGAAGILFAAQFPGKKTGSVSEIYTTAAPHYAMYIKIKTQCTFALHDAFLHQIFPYKDKNTGSRTALITCWPLLSLNVHQKLE